MGLKELIVTAPGIQPQADSFENPLIYRVAAQSVKTRGLHPDPLPSGLGATPQHKPAVQWSAREVGDAGASPLVSGRAGVSLFERVL